MTNFVLKITYIKKIQESDPKTGSLIVACAVSDLPRKPKPQIIIRGPSPTVRHLHVKNRKPQSVSTARGDWTACTFLLLRLLVVTRAAYSSSSCSTFLFVVAVCVVGCCSLRKKCACLPMNLDNHKREIIYDRNKRCSVIGFLPETHIVTLS